MDMEEQTGMQVRMAWKERSREAKDGHGWEGPRLNKMMPFAFIWSTPIHEKKYTIYPADRISVFSLYK